MASRYRQSTGRPEGSSRPALSASSIPALPPYKKPSHPLNAGAQQKLREIYTAHIAKMLEVQKSKTFTAIQNTSVAIIDHALTRERTVERKRKRWEKRGVSEDDGERVQVEEELRQLQEQVEQKTAELEKSMRAAVDEDVAQARIKKCVAWLRENASRQMEREYETQRMQWTQLAQRQRNGASSEDEEEDDEESGPTPGPTPLNGPRIELTGLSTLFTERMEFEKDQYFLHSHRTRYAQNNQYVGWRKVVHDARYGDTVPVPHADTWFDDLGRPALGVTATQADGDDDIVIQQATISTKCPITLQQFKEPYTSKKCPHSFEKKDVLTMIRANPHKAIQCPVTGCDQILSADDLHEDAFVIHKIKRIQQAEARQQAESESEDEGGDEEVVRAPSANIKDERQGVKRRATTSLPRSAQRPQPSQIVDMGDGSDETDEEED